MCFFWGGSKKAFFGLKVPFIKTRVCLDGPISIGPRSQSISRLWKNFPAIFPEFSRSFPPELPQSLVTQIAAISNRKSLATAIATQKITATLKTPLPLRFHCDFCGKSLRLQNCDWQLLAICDCDGVGH